MQSNQFWKVIVIIGALLVCGQSMWPPKDRLNLGIDLRGGTSLLYEVDTADARNPEEVIKQTIAVLQKRVDPSGVRNLIWRVEAGNRIEIQMPLASQTVIDARKAWNDAFDKIDDQNVTRAQVNNALRAAPDAQTEQLKKLEQGVSGRLEKLEAAATAYDQLQDARASYEKVKDDADKRIDEAGKVARAELAFDAAMKAVVETNIDPVHLGQTLELSTLPQLDDKTHEPIPDSSPRDKALAAIYKAHPGRVDQIKQVVAAYDAYQKVKGPLDDPEDLKRLLQGAGVLEFHIAVQQDQATNLQELRQQLAERGPRSAADAQQKWYIIDAPSTWADTPDALKALKADPVGYLARRGLIGAEYGGEYYILLWDVPGRSMTQRDRGWELSRASSGADQRGFPAVDFSLNEIGASLMGQLTGDNLHQQMAIVLDGRVFSAPTIQSQIRGSGQITGGRGGFSQKELEYLIQTLGAGSLKARLSSEPISERNIGPSLGADNLAKGLKSATDAMIIVAGFMFVYYFFAGLVADVALAANIIIILGIMASIKATFTLPGIAGVVLTIGMAVDANVLIYERIREEIRAGRDMAACLRLGYGKALSSIIDGNLTNLIVCVVLGYTATADVKGFAVTLGIGICATLFTALFMTRVIFEIYSRVVGIKKLNMLPLAVPAIERFFTPAVNWIGKRYMFYTFSGSLIILSIIAIGVRGKDIFDIEFRAGTEVEFDLKDGQMMKLDDVRARFNGTVMENDKTVVAIGAVSADHAAHRFAVITTNTDSGKVADIVRDAFKDVIDIQPVIHFAGENAESLAAAPVYPITKSKLAEVVNRPEVVEDAPDELGGVAILLDKISPPESAQALYARIKSMRLQPDFEQMQFRPFRVIGIAPDKDNPKVFTSAIVVTPPSEHASYFEDPGSWEKFAGDEWKVVHEGLVREKSLDKVSNFTPTVATTMVNNAIVALILSLLAIIVYIWFRFGSLRHGLAATAALFHDVIITLGLVAISGFIYDNVLGHVLLLDPFRINMAMIAAVLTIIGYSLNDTIIVFDRIRENRGKLAVATPAIITDSINQTVSRTVITSGTTFLAVFMMYLFGGDGVHGFTFAMTVGVIVGTYSSIAIASPLLLIGTKYARASAESSAPSPRTEPPMA
ncbi:MAG: protein translocase subunit SecD [Planctomycetes bacterium]|nr:protein translocase subunit SecD [Planctomycetota bacterium]